MSARCVGTYRFAVTGFTRSQPQPSARFPWFNHRSRNRSPPIELCGKHGTFCRTRPYTYNSREPTPIPGPRRGPGGSRRRRGRGPAGAGPADGGAGRWRGRPMAGSLAGRAGADGAHENGPRERWRWPKRARRGRPAGSEPVTGRVSPEMRPGPFTLTGPQPPERTPVTLKDASRHLWGCLL